MVEPEHRNALKVMLTKQQKSISMVDLFNSIYSRLQQNGGEAVYFSFALIVKYLRGQLNSQEESNHLKSAESVIIFDNRHANGGKLPGLSYYDQV